MLAKAGASALSGEGAAALAFLAQIAALRLAAPSDPGAVNEVPEGRSLEVTAATLFAGSDIHFVLRAKPRLVCTLGAGAAARLQAVVGLAAGMDAGGAPPAAAAEAYAALAAAGGGPPLSADEAGRLLALEQRTSYGVMAPSGAQVCCAVSSSSP